jgi:hypothetical protein
MIMTGTSLYVSLDGKAGLYDSVVKKFPVFK